MTPVTPSGLAPSGRPRDRAVVAVAMSGGVDSSVAAALCVEAGHDVFGIMLRLWAEPGDEAANRCCTSGAMDDARAVADVLGMPFSVLDFRAAFKAEVVDRFVDASALGDTPNPCFTCNRHVRFGHLLKQARALGADYLATGHYARVDGGPDGPLRLLRGVDGHKDQSYMLHRLVQDQLASAMFPVGRYPKTEVRGLARRFGLPVAARADSVDLCWVGEGGVPGFLARHLPSCAAHPGPIEDCAGRVLGEHRGLPFYTIGQRRGLGVATGEPVYVLRRDADRNVLVVGSGDGLMARTVHVDRMHWLGARPPREPLAAEAQIRYRSPAAAATIEPGADDRAVVRFERPQRAPTPGQGLVVYQGDVCLGGGRIRKRV